MTVLLRAVGLETYWKVKGTGVDGRVTEWPRLYSQEAAWGVVDGITARKSSPGMTFRVCRYEYWVKEVEELRV